MRPAIEATGLRKAFGDVVAVDGADLRVEAGQMLGLVGPDGAGKTTAIRLLTGVLPFDGGRAAVLGCDLRQQRRQIQRRVGYLSQQFSLYGDLTVDENVEFFARIHDVTDFGARRDELLAATQLTPFRARRAEHLSGGMKQKLALACTLIHQPELIFLDEPTTGVDPVSRRDFWAILADLRRGGITIVLTTPYLDEAERCTRVALMHAGRIARTDTPAAIVADLSGTLLEVRAERPREVTRALRADGGAASVQPFGDRVHVRLAGGDPAVAAQRLEAQLQTAGFVGVQVRPLRPTLEDAFIELLQRPAADPGRAAGARAAVAPPP